MCARLDGDFVVFLIGMRINSLWRIGDWLPVARAMPKMIKELEAHAELGFLGAEQWFSNRIAIVVQYWRSHEHLERYAYDSERLHLPAWRTLNQRMRRAGKGVGIWHETYMIPAGNYRTIYRNMPAFGLGKVGELVVATRKPSTQAPSRPDEIAA
jgi:hypothetical protein